jgi:hypothetical protein
VIVERQLQALRLRAECSEAYTRMAGSVLGTFERLAESGTQLRAGTRIRFGWSRLCLVEDGSDALRVTEPEFASWPEERWAPTLDITLAVLAAQTGLLHRLGVEGQDVGFDQLVIAAAGALAQPDVFLHRVGSSSAEDSGWLLGRMDDPEALTREDGLEPIAIASLVAGRRALLQALTLPLGFIIVFAGDCMAQIFDPAGRERSAAAG